MVLDTEAIVMPINGTIELSQIYPQNALNLSRFLLFMTKFLFILAMSLPKEHSTKVIEHFKLLKSLYFGLQNLKHYPKHTIIM